MVKIKEIVLKGRKVKGKGLYKLEAKTMSTSKVNLIIKNQNCLSKQRDSKKFVWHKRLAHLSFKTFHEFIQKNMP